MVDFQTDSDYRMVIKNGDFALSESEPTEARLIIVSAKGDWKQWPLVGVDLRKYLASPVGPREQAALVSEIRLQLKADGKTDVAFTMDRQGGFTLNLK